MSCDEKQRIIEAWDEHVKKHEVRFRFSTINAEQEEQFNTDFKGNILQSKKLTDEEKLEILEYAKL
jgi:hypothetical protein